MVFPIVSIVDHLKLGRKLKKSSIFVHTVFQLISSAFYNFLSFQLPFYLQQEYKPLAILPLGTSLFAIGLGYCGQVQFHFIYLLLAWAIVFSTHFIKCQYNIAVAVALWHLVLWLAVVHQITYVQ